MPDCSVCIHPQRAEIDRLLATDAGSTRNVAKQFGLHYTAIHRHATNHLPPAIVESVVLARREDNLNAFDGLARIYTRLNLALDAIDRQLYDAQTGEYIYDAQAMGVLVTTADALRKLIDSAAKLMAMLEAEREKRVAQEDAAAVLEELVLRKLQPTLDEWQARKILELLLAEEE